MMDTRLCFHVITLAILEAIFDKIVDLSVSQFFMVIEVHCKYLPSPYTLFAFPYSSSFKTTKKIQSQLRIASPGYNLTQNLIN